VLYLVALLLPPLALLLSGKPFQAIISGVIWILSFFFLLVGLGFFIWLFLAVWSILVVRDRNTKKMMEEVASRSQG
jgi:uncharacterized membrane protein